MVDLFPETKPQRQKPRVLMHVIDAGNEEEVVAVRMKCAKCRHETEWLVCKTVTEASRGLPCPVCNKKAGE